MTTERAVTRFIEAIRKAGRVGNDLAGLLADNIASGALTAGPDAEGYCMVPAERRAATGTQNPSPAICGLRRPCPDHAEPRGEGS